MYFIKIKALIYHTVYKVCYLTMSKIVPKGVQMHKIDEFLKMYNYNHERLGTTLNIKAWVLRPSNAYCMFYICSPPVSSLLCKQSKISQNGAKKPLPHPAQPLYQNPLRSTMVVHVSRGQSAWSINVDQGDHGQIMVQDHGQSRSFRSIMVDPGWSSLIKVNQGWSTSSTKVECL